MVKLRIIETKEQRENKELLPCPYCGATWSNATLNPRDRVIHHNEGCLLTLFVEIIIRDYQFPYWNRFVRSTTTLITRFAESEKKREELERELEFEKDTVEDLKLRLIKLRSYNPKEARKIWYLLCRFREEKCPTPEAFIRFGKKAVCTARFGGAICKPGEKFECRLTPKEPS